MRQALGNEYGVEASEPDKTYQPWSLLVDGKPFARFSPIRGTFVIRLSAKRIEVLVAGGFARRPGSVGRLPAGEWLAVRGESVQEWTALAREAMRFVRHID